MGDTYAAHKSAGSKQIFWKDIHVGIYLVMRCSIASWWEWLVGSTLFFWRWTNNHGDQARDGGNAWIYGNLTRFGKP